MSQFDLHNTIRFDIELAHIYPMIQEGDVQIIDLVEELRHAITSITNRHLKWESYASTVRETGGDGKRPDALHNEIIHYELS